MFKKIILCVFVILAFIGCEKSTKIETSVSIGAVSTENPIFIDKEKKTVTVLAKLNGKYLTENTRHLLIFEKGKFGGKSIFTALANQNDFYKALIAIGGIPGNNMSKDNATTTKVEGDKIDVGIFWEGAAKEYDVNEVVVDSNNKKIDLRFGGNEENALKFNTGCLACLDSCPVGVISNHAYVHGAVEKTGEVKFNGNGKILPKDGTFIAITFKLV